jgi:hypothetical protein
MRRLDWPERLVDVLNASSGKRADSYPCVLFAADCVLAMTGVDPMPARGDTAAACYAIMRREGYESVEVAISAKFKPIPLAFAKRGDVVLASGEVESVGICCGERTAFLAIEGGIAYRPTLEQRAAFSVPFED